MVVISEIYKTSYFLTPMSHLKKITHTFISGKLSTTLIIPIETARRYEIDKPSNVLIEETEDGILIKKLVIPEIEQK
jgi:hypothetical protein